MSECKAPGFVGAKVHMTAQPPRQSCPAGLQTRAVAESWHRSGEFRVLGRHSRAWTVSNVFPSEP